MRRVLPTLGILIATLAGPSRACDPPLVVPVAPYAIIASVFNLEDRLEEFFESFAPYKDRMWLISDGSTDNTLLRLTQAGWRCFDDFVFALYAPKDGGLEPVAGITIGKARAAPIEAAVK